MNEREQTYHPPLQHLPSPFFFPSLSITTHIYTSPPPFFPPLSTTTLPRPSQTPYRTHHIHTYIHTYKTHTHQPYPFPATTTPSPSPTTPLTARPRPQSLSNDQRPPLTHPSRQGERIVPPGTIDGSVARVARRERGGSSGIGVCG